MSILTMCPSPEWYEPDDLEDDEDPEVCPVELLTVAAGIGWWTSSLELPDLD